MTDASVPIALAGALVGAGVAALMLPRAIRNAPEGLVRTNVLGMPVPAVLGAPLCGGALVGLATAALLDGALDAGAIKGEVAAATGSLVLALGAAGFVDDRRGDERERGFGGHLRAVGSGRLTGGALKVIAGGIASLVAAGLVWGVDAPADVASTALGIALSANLLNLLDRAPGRAAKVGLVLLVPPVALAGGSLGWPAAVAGLVGALLVCLPADLRARAMLGDAGANPLGAVAGLGLCLAAPLSLRIVLVLVLLGLNLASERISFSRVIERTGWLAALDRWGRA
ncbi:MAG: hypothetical protein M3391_10665 [Actinomycetota bacterium]|nr:hypothetical protein [Actinomycetota bacterium]